MASGRSAAELGACATQQCGHLLPQMLPQAEFEAQAAKQCPDIANLYLYCKPEKNRLAATSQHSAQRVPPTRPARKNPARATGRKPSTNWGVLNSMACRRECRATGITKRKRRFRRASIADSWRSR
jgi:hypothetical protein